MGRGVPDVERGSSLAGRRGLTHSGSGLNFGSPRIARDAAIGAAWAPIVRRSAAALLLEEQRPDVGEEEVRIEEVEPVDVPDPLLGIDEIDPEAVTQAAGLAAGRSRDELTVASEDRRQG